MGWFDRKPVWNGAAFLMHVAKLAGFTEPVATEIALTGTLHGFPIHVAIDDDGDVQSIVLRHGPGVPGLDLQMELDPMEELDPRQIRLVGDVVVDGPHAQRQAAAFWALPRDIQERLPGAVRRLHITRMEGRHKRLDIDVHRPPEDVTARAQWLADVLVLAADFARGRGARPPNARPPRELAPALAQELAARMPGASVAVRDDGFAIQGSAATMVLCGDDLSIEVAGDVASETRDAFEELTARHEVVSITTGDHLISLGICELDEVDDGGARVHAIATELVALIRR